MAERKLEEILDPSELDPTVLDALPEDAPEGHIAHEKVKLNTTHANPLARTRLKDPAGTPITFQVTVSTSGSAYACLRIARALYVKLADGEMSRDQALQWRDDIYATLRPLLAGTAGKAPAAANYQARARQHQERPEGGAGATKPKAKATALKSSEPPILLQKTGTKAISWLETGLSPNTIQLKNTDSKASLYQVLSNNVKNFTVTPSTGRLEAAASVDLALAFKDEAVSSNADAKVAFLIKAGLLPDGSSATKLDELPKTELQDQKVERVVGDSCTAKAAKAEATAEGNGKKDKKDKKEKKDKKDKKEKKEHKSKDALKDVKKEKADPSQRPGDSRPCMLYYNPGKKRWEVSSDMSAAGGAGAGSSSSSSLLGFQEADASSKAPVAAGARWRTRRKGDEKTREEDATFEEATHKSVLHKDAGNIKEVKLDRIEQPAAKKQKTAEKEGVKEEAAKAKKESSSSKDSSDDSSDEASGSGSGDDSSSSSSSDSEAGAPAAPGVVLEGSYAPKLAVLRGFRCACHYRLKSECPSRGT
eukprot:TRINITY_DN4338_c0_g4_i1.p1 TRINITY_DN4338_c0_g4~~TRINITY_DN4338_c0_g4_i1.p1  ORF type:complete len:534 (-),score=176.51 TRINITY_DN4338_c0_g4_i1:200-1801(-)